jgi:hypothetical protein
MLELIEEMEALDGEEIKQHVQSRQDDARY